MERVVEQLDVIRPSVLGKLSQSLDVAFKGSIRQEAERTRKRNRIFQTLFTADLARDPSNDRALQVYNYSVGRIASLLQSTGKLSRAGAVTLGTGASAYKLTFTSDVKDFADPQTSHFIPADELAISGKYYTRRIRREGIARRHAEQQ
jgi:hypothetical protein